MKKTESLRGRTASLRPGPGPSPLQKLLVIDRLEVGPIRLDGDRLVAPYTVTQGERRDSTDFVYRFEEPVFDPLSPGSQNLAAVMAAQVALNYGLFCREIVVRGLVDRHDRRFLLDMASNTAREIYVKKLLQPNPYLVRSFEPPPAVKLADYLQARFRFPDGVEEIPAGPSATEQRASDAGRGETSPGYAVLSSGGKESLLSFALLREIGGDPLRKIGGDPLREIGGDPLRKIGGDPRAVFINESGRHWFTALNAYRHFKGSYPGTARVWTSADRVFSWMLRHLPFIRQDFARVRGDDYPIRLWTVAVLLFGAIPLMRARGLTRLVIGDEHDTTRRLSFKGITHYDGLYDQSRYFDHAMSRYFQRKGWDILQFSLLRPLSELLVEKILLERYPDLQRQQVSCHATHTEGDRVVPCGRCEKCRRVVGMLSALGVDARRCGYTSEQIKDCLDHLTRVTLHQEADCARHVRHLLAERGLLQGGPGALFEPCPEVLKLRFDPERSPMDTLPADLRRPLLRIFLEHASGSVRRSGRIWIPFDPLNDSEIERAPVTESGTVTVAPSETVTETVNETGAGIGYGYGHGSRHGTKS
ncbi:MAG: hypothetical protein AB1486_17470 [Planctomycetota bacterium]